MKCNITLRGLNFGFQDGKSAKEPIKILQTIIDSSYANNTELCVTLVDIKKAYDSLEYLSIHNVFIELGLDKKYLDLLKIYHIKSKM